MLFLLCSFSAFAADNLIYSQVEINVEKAGTLSTLVGNDRKFRITNLKLSGELNGTDIKLLREMAGADMNDNLTDGNLADLDLSDVKIVKQQTSWNSEYYRQTQSINEDNIIPNGMFYNCGNLVSLKLPKAVTKIEQYSFYYCQKLKTITLYNGIVSIGQDCFNHCVNLSSIVLPNSLVSLGEYAFASCTNLETVTLSNQLSELLGGTFRTCKALTSINIPSSIKSIGSVCFEECPNLKYGKVYVDNMCAWCHIDFYDKTSNPLVYGAKLFLKEREVKDVSIPTEVQIIKRYAFVGCSSLETLVIPNTLDSIKEYSFSGCTNLKVIKCFNNMPPVIISQYSNSASWTSITDDATSDSKITLYVPSGCMDAYKKCKVWKEMTINEGYHGEYHLSDANSILPVGIYPIGELDYTRDKMKPGTYESFCLPFDINLNEVSTAFESVYVLNNMALYRKDGSLLLTLKRGYGLISAGQPFVAKIKDSVTSVTFTNKNFVNNKMEVMPNPKVFYPQVYDWDGKSGMLIANTSAKIGIAGMYSSVSDAEAEYDSFKNNGIFESIESNDFLPYRVYATKANSYTQNMVKQITIGVDDEVVNGIKLLLSSEKEEKDAVYSVDGRLLNTTGSLINLPAGVYIKNHKKILVKE